MEYIRELAALRSSDLPLAGGKGANLGELVAAGLPVPDGFVLTTDAYRHFIHANDLADRIRELVTSHAPERAAAEIARLFGEGELPSEVGSMLTEAYARLGEQAAVAVRSSATAEDLADASFAGQQETFLNVRGGSALTRAVRDCWASLWSTRAISYRGRSERRPAARHRGERRSGDRHGAGGARPGGLLGDAAGGDPGRRDHHPGLDAAVRAGRRRGHRCGRPAEPLLHRRAGVRDPGRARHHRGHRPDPHR
ncbi:hypothetical protein HJ590_00875 [Naumannella sp. ID2617S]|nr:hypothetical protein [Naumannella sp. ID2617S]